MKYQFTNIPDGLLPEEWLPMTFTPYFSQGNDCGCHHPPESYVCSFVAPNHTHKQLNKFDLYVYVDSNKEHHVCIRCGNDASAYWSPGTLKEFVKSALQTRCSEHYTTALRCLEFLGKIQMSWTPKTEPINADYY